MRAKIAAIESYLPENVEDSEALLSDNPGWDIKKIISKTGIEKRRIAKKNETSLDLGFRAGKKILDKINADSIDTLIFITQSPDYFLPTSACILQDKLGLSNNIKCFDVNQGCSGYIYGLSIASSFIESKNSKNVLLICSDTYSKFVNKHDRTCRPIFSDGATATLITESNNEQIGPFKFGTDGSDAEKNIITLNGGSKTNFNKKPEIFMDGKNVFLFSLANVPLNINSLLELSSLNKNDINMFFFHQASKLIVTSLIEKLNIDNKKAFCNYKLIGNTISSSIPLALKDAANQKRIKKNDLLLLSGFGVGLSWGSCIVRWEGLI